MFATNNRQQDPRSPAKQLASRRRDSCRSFAQGDSSRAALHKQCFLRTLDCLDEYAIDLLRPHLDKGAQSDATLALSALKALVSMAVSLDQAADIARWADWRLATNKSCGARCRA